MNIIEMVVDFGEWEAGDAVMHNGYPAHVIACRVEEAVENHARVPIIYDCKSAQHVLVPAVDLQNRFGMVAV